MNKPRKANWKIVNHGTSTNMIEILLLKGRYHTTKMSKFAEELREFGEVSPPIAISKQDHFYMSVTVSELFDYTRVQDWIWERVEVVFGDRWGEGVEK